MSGESVVQAGLSYQRLGLGLAVDLVAITVLAYLVYFRRHHRRELLMAFVCFNVALFAVVTVLATGNATTGLALGLGLLGALSIIRLRSRELSFTDVAYFFSSLALAIVNGVGIGNRPYAALLSAIVVGTMYVMDHLEPHRNVQRMELVLDQVYANETALRAEVERRLGVDVVAATVNQVDYVRDVTQLEVQYVSRSSPVGDAPVREPEGEELRSWA